MNVPAAEDTYSVLLTISIESQSSYFLPLSRRYSFWSTCMFMSQQKGKLYNPLHLSFWVIRSSNFLFYFFKWFLIFSIFINSNDFPGSLIYPLQQKLWCYRHWEHVPVVGRCNDASHTHASPGLSPRMRFPSLPLCLAGSCLSFKTQLMSTLRSSSRPWLPLSTRGTFLVVSLIKHWR